MIWGNADLILWYDLGEHWAWFVAWFEGTLTLSCGMVWGNTELDLWQGLREHWPYLLAWFEGTLTLSCGMFSGRMRKRALGKSGSRVPVLELNEYFRVNPPWNKQNTVMSSIHRLITCLTDDWLTVGWTDGWWMGGLIDWLIDWLINWLINWNKTNSWIQQTNQPTDNIVGGGEREKKSGIEV